MSLSCLDILCLFDRRDELEHRDGKWTRSKRRLSETRCLTRGRGVAKGLEVLGYSPTALDPTPQKLHLTMTAEEFEVDRLFSSEKAMSQKGGN
jgi:hypothetical protein